MRLYQGLAGALAGGLLLAGSASAQTIKIGLITTYSGSEAEAGDQMDKGLRLYMEEHKKDLPPGVTIELVTRDDTGPKPEVAKRLAQELITREHVNFLAGAVWTPNAAAIAPLTAEAKVPFVIMNAVGSGITRMSPYVVRVSFTQWQLGIPIGEWTAKQGYKRGYTAVSDFIPGYDAEAAFTKGFKDNGGEILGAVRFPLVDPDFAPFVQRIKDVKPDVVFTFMPAGRMSTAMMKTWSDLGLKEAGVKLVSTMDLLPDDELQNMGDAPLDVISVGDYSAAATRPANLAFLAAWKRAYGAHIPNFLAVGGWDGMAAIFAVIEQTKGRFDADQAMAILKTWKSDSPRGPIAIDPATRDIVQDIYIRRVEKRDGKLENIEFATIPQVKDPWKELNPAR